MPLSPSLAAGVLETILSRLAIYFLTAGSTDNAAAGQSAARMLATYRPETKEELYLAANVISFGFQALDALAEAGAPDVPSTRKQRLRGSAVSLNRQSEKARRSLSQLQKDRQQNRPAEPAQPKPAQPDRIDQIPLAFPARPPAPAQTEAECQNELRIAASIKRAEARVAAFNNAASAPPTVAPPPDPLQPAAQAS